jgi:hypothetical protein
MTTSVNRRLFGWSHTIDFEFILGLDALLGSLSFLVPPDLTGMLCCPFRKLDISSTITFSGDG